MSEQPRPLIVVGVDGSRAVLAAVRWAAGEARQRSTGLRIVTAVPAGPDAGADWEAFPNDVAADFVASGHAAVGTASTLAEELAPELSVVEDVVCGRPAAALVAESHRADRLVVGARGLGELGGVVVGSTAEAVVAHAQCPVVVVRDAASGVSATGPVVVGLDGSAGGRAVMGEACAEALTRGVELVAVRTWSDVGFEQREQAAVVVAWNSRRASEQAALDEELAPWREWFPDLVVRGDIARDRPAHALLHRSGRAQLLVVGGRGRGGFPGMRLGSTARVLVHACQCPLMVVPVNPPNP